MIRVALSMRRRCYGRKVLFESLVKKSFTQKTPKNIVFEQEIIFHCQIYRPIELDLFLNNKKMFVGVNLNFSEKRCFLKKIFRNNKSIVRPTLFCQNSLLNWAFRQKVFKLFKHEITLDCKTLSHDLILQIGVCIFGFVSSCASKLRFEIGTKK